MKASSSSPLGQVSDFELRLLRVFRTVAACGGFAAAEVALGVSRAAISVQMADLEKRLGVRLCQRGRAGFALTDEGRRVLEASDRLFGAVDHFHTEISDLHRHLQGTLVIGITDNLVSHPGMKITHGLAALKARGPDVRIDLRMQPSDDIEMGVLDGRLNVGVIPQVRELPGLSYAPLYEESTRLYCADTHPLFAVPHPDVFRHQVVQPRFAQPAAASALYARHITGAQANDREGVLFLVLTGCYLGYLPEHYAAPWVSAGRLRALSPGFTTHFCAITARSRRPGLVLKTFLQTLEA